MWINFNGNICDFILEKKDKVHASLLACTLNQPHVKFVFRKIKYMQCMYFEPTEFFNFLGKNFWEKCLWGKKSLGKKVVRKNVFWGKMSCGEKCRREKCRREKCCREKCHLGKNVTEP